MKVLVLTASKREPDFSTVYQTLQSQLDVDIVVLNSAEQKSLRRSLRSFNLRSYDRIMVDLRFKYVHRQARFLRTLSGLLIYEEDACQNYLPGSRWCGRFSAFYKRVPNAQIVVTGASVAQRLQNEGINARFIPKGYDSGLLCSTDGQRDIELGFIGRTTSGVYAERKRILDALVIEEGLQMLRTEPGLAYRDMLNRVKFFISADIGFGEYMAKNFEAMACGCLVFAWRQESEERAIGLVDGVHLRLYSSLTELRNALEGLRKCPETAARIAEQGKSFVQQNLSHVRLSEHLAAVLCEPFPKPARLTLWDKFISLSWLR